jgi:hypothetical protein
LERERRLRQEDLKLTEQAGWNMPIIPAFERWRQEDCKFQTILGYTVRLSEKNKTN